MTLRAIAIAASLVATALSFAHPPDEHGNHVHEHDAALADKQPFVKIEVRGDYRYVTANGLPDHATGDFPNRNNPNEISAQQYRFRMPATPRRAGEYAEFGNGLFGVAVNGVVFDPATAEYWQPGDAQWGSDVPPPPEMRRNRQGPPNPRAPGNWQVEGIGPNGGTLGIDASNAHVQPSGAYHYHGLPNGLIKRLGGRGETMLLLGWAADGFPVYAPWAHEDPNDASSPLVDMTSSWKVKDGDRPTGRDGPGGTYDGTYTQDYEFVENGGTLDRANGREGVTPEFPEGTYYYVLTPTFPFVPRHLAAAPDESFQRRGGPNNNPPRQGPPLRNGPGNRPPRPPR